jgi:hypothetical protein
LHVQSDDFIIASPVHAFVCHVMDRPALPRRATFLRATTFLFGLSKTTGAPPSSTRKIIDDEDKAKMVLATAFDRQRGGRRRGGFGKSSSTSTSTSTTDHNNNDAMADLVLAAAVAQTTANEREVVMKEESEDEEEPMERLWSDREEEDDGDDETENCSSRYGSNQRILLASDSVDEEEETKEFNNRGMSQHVGNLLSNNAAASIDDDDKVPSDEPGLLAMLATEADRRLTNATVPFQPPTEHKENGPDDDESATAAAAAALLVVPDDDDDDPQEIEGQNEDSETADEPPQQRQEQHESIRQGIQDVITTIHIAATESASSSKPAATSDDTTSAAPSARTSIDEENPAQNHGKKKKKIMSAGAATSSANDPLDHLDLDDILASTEQWFAQVTDKKSVTVKDIGQSLCLEYNVSVLPKAMKKAVRQRLTELMAEDNDDENGEQDDETFGDKEEDEATAMEGDSESSGGSDNEGKSRRTRPMRENVLATKRKKKKDIVKPTKASTKLAQKAHAQLQRQRQLQAARVVSEELNALQSQQDEAIGDAITNALDELENDTLPQRLALLSKLDEKRLICLRDDNDDNVPPPTTPSASSSETKTNPPQQSPLPEPKSLTVEKDQECSSSDSDEDDDDDDMELEIEGPVQSLGQHLVPLLRSPPRRKSPLKQQNSRAALRAQLLQRQRTMGNLWLARELGYQNEQEHLQDCRAAELVKRRKMQQLEEAKAAQRALQRERLLQGVVADADDNDNADNETTPAQDVPQALLSSQEDDSEEDDEEALLAKELEKEAMSDSADCRDAAESPPPPNDDLALTVVATAATEPSDPHQKTSADESEPQTPVDDDSSLRDPMQPVVDIAVAAASDLPLAIQNDLARDSTEGDADLNTLQLSTDSAPLGSNPSPSCIADPVEEKFATITSDSTAVASTMADLLDFADVDDDEDEVDEERPYETQPADTVAVVTDECSPIDGGALSSKEPLHESSTVPDPEALAKRKREKNLAWKAILEKDKKAAKRKNNSSLIEDEADEEEEEAVAGLEDFGFVVKKKKDDGEIEPDGEYNEDDLQHVVDELSDNEGDEDAGEKARKVMERKEEKLRHKEIMRRMREGYDGRRGGIAGGGASRGLHRFDQLVAADNREDAKRLGLLNDDELDSEDDDDDDKGLDDKEKDEEEDEAALLDKIIKDRFLHRSSVQENFEEDNDADGGTDEVVQDPDDANKGLTQEQLEELEQERLAKRFSKRARMTRLVETHGDNEEFSQSRLIDDDKSMLAELQSMKVSVFCRLTDCLLYTP